MCVGSCQTVSHFWKTSAMIPCHRAGWVSTLLLEWLRNAVQPPGSRTCLCELGVSELLLSPAWSIPRRC